MNFITIVLSTTKNKAWPLIVLGLCLGLSACSNNKKTVVEPKYKTIQTYNEGTLPSERRQEFARLFFDNVISRDSISKNGFI